MPYENTGEGFTEEVLSREERKWHFTSRREEHVLCEKTCGQNIAT